MVSDIVQYVRQHPPRCIGTLRPEPSSPKRPTVLLPPHLSIYHKLRGEAASVSFTIGCSCGNRAVYLLGYYAFIEGRRQDRFFVGPLGLSCPECGAILELFDTREHGYDGEQGINTNIVGNGEPDSYECPQCGATPMILQPTFSYRDVEWPEGPMRERVQDYFDTFDITGTCARCKEVIEITWFECD